MKPRVAIIGANGRMGKALEALLASAPSSMTCTGRVDSRTSRDELNACLARSDVYIDVSSPAGTAAVAQAARAHRCAAVIGTTGLSAETHDDLAKLALTVPVLVAANFSLGVNLLLSLAAQAARALPSWDCEITEAHHRDKRDAPSGTALALGAAIAQARTWPPNVIRTARQGLVGPRAAQEIAIASVRGGDVVGEHTVMLLGTGERLELSHRATDRRIFANGALTAAAWICEKPAGSYTMADVLALPT